MASIKKKQKIFFPHKRIRKQQDKLLNDVWSAVSERKHLVAHAPTGLGKCCIFETPVLTEKGICQIGEIVEGALEKNRAITEQGIYSVPEEESFVWAFNPVNGKIEKAKIKAFYKKEKCKNLIKIKTSLGKEVMVTPEHPFFVLNETEFDSITASELREDDFIVCPNKISFNETNYSVPLKAYVGLNAFIREDFGKKIKKLLIEELKGSNPKQAMRYWRLTNGLSCKAYARELKVNFHTYNGWEYSKYRVPKEVVSKIENSIKKTQLKKISVDFLTKLVKENKISEKECKKAISSFKHPRPIKREKPIKPVWKITPLHCRFAAYVLADGSIHSPSILFYNSDKRLLEDFENISKKCFGITPKLNKQKSTTTCEVVSKALVCFLREVFDFKTSGGKSNSGTHVLPSILFKLPKEHQNAFLAAFFDCEAHITPLPSIEVMTKSKELAVGLSYLFLEYGLQTRTKEKVCSATNSPAPKKRTYYRLTFFGFAARKLLKELPIITKKQNLTPKKENTNYDVIPIDGKQIVKLRKRFFLSQSDFDKVIYLYEQNKRNPSRKGFQKLIKRLEERQGEISKVVQTLQELKQRHPENRGKWIQLLKDTLKENRIPIRPLYGKAISKKPSVKKLEEITEFFVHRLKKPLEFDLKKLERVGNKEVFFDKIESIEKLKEKQAVYDITVDSLHTFVGGTGPIVLHNTAAVISPALSFALRNEKTVFFLTPKISQHEIAVQLVKDLNKKFDLNIKGTDLVGRKYMCTNPFLSEAESSSFYELCKKKRKNEECEFFANTIGFNSKQRQKARVHQNKLRREYKGIWSHLELKDYCEHAEKKLCAYEAAMLMAKNSNIIIGDYYHLFNPGVQGVILHKAGKKLKECVLIIDEAHNLPERVRKLLSSSLSTYSIKRAVKELKKLNQPDLIPTLRELKKELKKIAREKLSPKKTEALISKKKLSTTLKKIDKDQSLALELRELGTEYIEAFPQGRAFLVSIANFLERWSEEKPSYIRIIKSTGKSVSVQLKALDPGTISRKIFKKAHSSVLMSGTLLPTKMYADLLGLEEKRTELKEYSSPFPKENKLSLVVPSVTTKYTQRSPEQFKKIAGIVSSTVNKVPGNSAVFFPSFQLVEAIAPLIEENTPRKILKQKRGMNTRERFNLLKEFRKQGKGFGSILLAVASGSFAEGIDFLGEQLLAAIIVGIPLGEMDLETKCLIEYYQKKFGAGWHYGYLYPAVVRAIQASGRVIRDRTDMGVTVFLDKRYTWQNYKKCFPKDFDLITTKKPQKLVEEFWKNNNKTH